MIRKVRRWTTLAACALFAVAAQALVFPDRPVKNIVAQTPGGASDALARIVVQELNRKRGQSVAVENRAGAGGNVGMEVVAAKKGSLTFGSAGKGSVNHLPGKMVNSAAGVKPTHVPYRGAAPAMQDLMGGQDPPGVHESALGVGVDPAGYGAPDRRHERQARGFVREHRDRG